MRADPAWRSGVWTKDRQTYWALNAARRRHALIPPYSAYGRTVLKGTPKLPYGRSTHARGYLTHIADGIYTAWLNGRLLAAVVRWRCGPMTDRFRLLDEPDSTMCPLCTITRPWLER